MQEWKLPSQLVITDRDAAETVVETCLRHERVRRVTAEHDLIQALDFIDSLKTSKDELVLTAFLARFMDKTINN